MTYNRRGLGSVSREENKYSFWQLYSCRSHKDNWKRSKAGQEIQLQRAVQLEKIGEFISYILSGSRKRSENFCQIIGGKGIQGQGMTAILWFSLGTSSGQTRLYYDWHKAYYWGRVIPWLWWHYIQFQYIESTITINFVRTTSHVMCLDMWHCHKINLQYKHLSFIAQALQRTSTTTSSSWHTTFLDHCTVYFLLLSTKLIRVKAFTHSTITNIRPNPASFDLGDSRSDRHLEST